MKSIILIIVALMMPGLVGADVGIPAVSIVDDASGNQTWSVSIQILMLMTALTFLPSVVLAATSFTRIIIVLAILRQAIGMPQTPPNQVLIGLALFLSFFVMSPVLTDIYDNSVEPYLAGTIEFGPAAMTAQAPLREFMLSQTREPDLMLFAGLAGDDGYASTDDVPLTVLLPSFLTSE